MSSKIITYNVSGKLFTLYLDRLERIVPDSLLTVLATTEVGAEKDKDGNIFLDLNPKIFYHIWQYILEGGNIEIDITSEYPKSVYKPAIDYLWRNSAVKPHERPRIYKMCRYLNIFVENNDYTGTYTIEELEKFPSLDEIGKEVKSYSDIEDYLKKYISKYDLPECTKIRVNKEDKNLYQKYTKGNGVILHRCVLRYDYCTRLVNILPICF